MVIGSLVTNIVADLSKWGPNLDKARGKMAAFTRQVSTLQAVAAGAAAAALAGVVKSAVDVASSLNDASQKLRLNVESLQRYRFAMSQVGGTAGQMDKAVSIFNKTLGNALFGNKGAIEAFDRLGLSAEKLKNLSVDDSLLQTLKAISLLPGSQQAAAVTGIFGKGGQDLLPAIRNLKEFVMWMERIRPVSADAVSGLDAVGDEMNLLAEQWKNLKTEGIATFGGPLNLYMKYWQGNLEGIRRTAGLIRDILRDMRGYTIPAPVKPVQQFGQQGPPLPAGFPSRAHGMNVMQPMTPAMTGNRPSVMGPAPPIVQWQNSRDASRGMLQAQNAFSGVLNMLPNRIALAIRNATGTAPALGPFGDWARNAGGALASLSNMGARATPDMTHRSLAFTRAGTAESFRQRAAIGQQNEQAKTSKNHLKEAQKQTGIFNQLLGAFTNGAAEPAGIF